MLIDSDYMSHTPVLSAACHMTSGDILELGAGFGSTPLLHGICAAQNRQIVTLDTTKGWIREFNALKTPWHTFKCVPNFLALPEYGDDWGIAFVDHGIIEQRSRSIDRLKHVPMVVVHDTDSDLYGYEEVLKQFKYRWDYRWAGSQTSVVSNSIDVSKAFSKFGLPSERVETQRAATTLGKGVIGVATQELSRYTAFHTALAALRVPDYSVQSYATGNNTAKNYNDIIRFALANDFDWVWLIDNDHDFAPDTLLRLLAHGKQIVAPMMIRKSHPYGTMIHNSLADGLEQIAWSELDGKTGLIDVSDKDIASTGILMRREVLEAVGDPWFTNITSMPENAAFDLEFCEKARDCGYKIYVDTEISCGHIGPIAVWPERDENGKWSSILRPVH